MTVSRTAKHLMWLALAVACLAVYIVLVRRFGLGSPWKFLGATQLRAFAPAAALFLAGCDLMRFVRAEREEDGEKVKTDSQDRLRDMPVECVDRQERARTQAAPKTPENAASSRIDRGGPPAASLSPADDATGEADYAEARAMPHQPIPDFEFDGPYLDLLGKSAAAGYVPALSKLGEYAMRRSAWVEAYYWMSMAKRRGMKNPDAILRKIRKHWSQDGFPRQSSNVSELFTPEAGSIGRALLHIDSGHEAAKAKEFLRTNHPELLA